MRAPPFLPALLLAALGLAGCGATPDYFLLPAPRPAQQVSSPVGSIVVADMSLPAYASALEIASLTAPGVVGLDKAQLWADTPQRALTRQLSTALGERLRARVGTEPWPGFDSPGLRVEVTVDRFIGAEGGALDFAGQYFLISPSSGQITGGDRFAFSVPSQGEGYPGLLAAHAVAIDLLAARIAGSVTGRPVS